MRKCLTAGSHGGISSTEAPFSVITPACVKLTQNQRVQGLNLTLMLTLCAADAEYLCKTFKQVFCHCALSHEARCGTFECSGLGDFQMEESTLACSVCISCCRAPPGKLRHSYRLDAAGNADDFPASKGRGETLGKGASLTTHTVF